MPLWGWVLVLTALAMLVAVLYRSLATGGYH